MSSRDIVNLKALTAEYADQFSKEGKTASKGKSRKHKLKSKDPFSKPSPGLIKRLAAESRYDAKRRRFSDDDAGPSDEQRRAIMEAKAAKYDRIRKGDLRGMTEKEIKEAALDLDNMAESSGSGSSDDNEDEEIIEYEDDLGRTRRGTRAEARANGARPTNAMDHPPENSAYAEVLQSNVIRGDQNFFPIYEPDPDALREKYRKAEEESRQVRYDASKEGMSPYSLIFTHTANLCNRLQPTSVKALRLVHNIQSLMNIRDRAAGAYQFSLDDTTRLAQLAELKAQRLETERARAELSDKRMSAAQEERQRKLGERRAMLEAKRVLKFGGAENLARLRREKVEREAEGLLAEVQRGFEPDLVAKDRDPQDS